MSLRSWAIVAVVAAGGFAWRLWPTAPPPLHLPAEIGGRPGRLVVVTAETPAGVVRWHVCGGGVDSWHTADGKTLLLCAAAPGRCTVLAWTAAGDRPTEAATCIVRFEEPTPPVPPDSFAAALQMAWDTEASADKGRQRDALANFYRTAAVVAVQSQSATLGELYAALQREIAGRIAADALPKLRAAVAAEFRTKLPTNPSAPLDAATRDVCRTQFERVGKLLDALH